jgi:sugar (pentulose or hexulose) kinase
MSENYLAFDLGGSGGKLLICRFDGERLVLEDVHRFRNEPLSVNDCLYWDLWHIYRQMNQGIRKAMDVAGGRIRSIGLDSFSNDHAFIDGRGELLTPLRCYRDKRTERYREAIYGKMSPDRLYALSGNQIAPFNTLMQLAAMREAGQGYILDNASMMLFTPDLLIHFMTGEAATEYTMASVSQMFDFARDDWSEEILRAFDIPRELLGRIAPTGSIVGKTRGPYNRELGIPGLDVVSVCEHDTASAFLAATCKGERAIISSGTWSLVGTEIPAPIIKSFGYRHNIANEGGFGGRHRLLRNVMGLWIVQELKRQYEVRGESCGFAEMESAAALARPFAHKIDPDDFEFFAPADMEAAIAGRCMARSGRAPETMGETLRCVYESLAFKYRWAIEKIEELTGRSLPVVNVVGGGSRNKLLCQFTANACGKPVLAGPTDATALGNVLVQLLADGRVSSLEEGKELVLRSFPLEEYLPQERESWDGAYGEFTRVFALA